MERVLSHHATNDPLIVLLISSNNVVSEPDVKKKTNLDTLLQRVVKIIPMFLQLPERL